MNHLLSPSLVAQTANAIHQVVSLFFGFALSTTFNGYARALTAYVLGDDTPKNDGFLSLDPSVHTDLANLMVTLSVIIGLSFVLPVDMVIPAAIAFMVLMGGRRVTPILFNMRNFSSPRFSLFLSNIMGPVGSFFFSGLVVLCALLFHLSLSFIPVAYTQNPSFVTVLSSIATMMRDTAVYGAYWGALDLLPFAPYSLGRALLALLPDEMDDLRLWLILAGPWLTILCFIIPPLRNTVIMPLLSLAVSFVQTFYIKLFSIAGVL